MKLLRLLLLAIFACPLLCPNAFAQNYNAGVGSGTGGNNNVFVGPYTGRLTIGAGNVFLGNSAGYSNISGNSNAFVGYQAGYSNISGNSNAFVGYMAGYSNQGGTYNNFLGYMAGYSNTSGHYNNFMGNRAGYSNTGGNYNIFLGTSAGESNISGSSNTFIGPHAGSANTTASNNVFIGYQAGELTTTSGNNTFLGTFAGRSNTTGFDNLFMGSQSGYSNTTGTANIFLGFKAGFSNTTGFSNTALGWQAAYAITTGGRNSFFGNYAGNNTTTGTENVFMGRSAGEKNVDGFYNVSLGTFAGPSLPNLINSVAIGNRATVSASNALVLGSINGMNGATASTQVGIGTTAPAYLLHVNGSAAKPGGGSWTVASDERLKKDVSDFTDGLKQLSQIRPVWFRYNGKAGLPTEKKYVGVIAQEMQRVAPYTVGKFVYTDITGQQEQYLDYDANALSYMLVNAVKEVDQKYAQQLKEKDALLRAQQQQINTLTDRLAKLEALLTPTPSAESGAQLWQNEPNPSDGTTVIRYFLPQRVGSAQLKVYSLKGQEVHSVELTQKGNGQVQLSGREFASGVYVYHLMVDGQSIASKKLILEK